MSLSASEARELAMKAREEKKIQDKIKAEESRKKAEADARQETEDLIKNLPGLVKAAAAEGKTCVKVEEFIASSAELKYILLNCSCCLILIALLMLPFSHLNPENLQVSAFFFLLAIIVKVLCYILCKWWDNKLIDPRIKSVLDKKYKVYYSFFDNYLTIRW